MTNTNPIAELLTNTAVVLAGPTATPADAVAFSNILNLKLVDIQQMLEGQCTCADMPKLESMPESTQANIVELLLSLSKYNSKPADAEYVGGQNKIPALPEDIKSLSANTMQGLEHFELCDHLKMDPILSLHKSDADVTQTSLNISQVPDLSSSASSFLTPMLSMVPQLNTMLERNIAFLKESYINIPDFDIQYKSTNLKIADSASIEWTMDGTKWHVELKNIPGTNTIEVKIPMPVQSDNNSVPQQQLSTIQKSFVEYIQNNNNPAISFVLTNDKNEKYRTEMRFDNQPQQQSSNNQQSQHKKQDDSKKQR